MSLRSTALLLLLTLLVTGCSRNGSETVKAAENGPAPIAVKTALAEARTVERSIAVTGSLAADETVTVSSEVPGRVTRINQDFGQYVRKGDVIAQLDTQELSLQLDRSRASLAQALARIGMDAKTPDQVPEATPMMRQAWNQMEDARQKYENAAKLVKSGDISQERFNELEKSYRARQAAYEATRDDLRTQLAAIQSLQADVKLAEKRVRDATVIAPFEGSVSEKLVTVGQYIKENVPIVTLVKTHPLRLRVDVPESAVSDVKIGTTLTFTTDAVPGAEFHAVVRELNPAIDARSRSLKVEARLVEREARLRPGAFVQVRLVTAKATPVIAVPRAAIYTVAGLNKVFAIRDGKAIEVKVDEVLASNGWVEIPAGKLEPGTPVAISNLALLTNGAAVQAAGKS